MDRFPSGEWAFMTIASLCLDRGGYFAVNAQQVWNRFWRPAAKTAFGGDAKRWSVAYSSSAC